MGIYIGIIEKKGYTPNIFFNFKPIAEVQNSQVIMLSPQEQEALLPESEKRNICFSSTGMMMANVVVWMSSFLKAHLFCLSSL